MSILAFKSVSTISGKAFSLSGLAELLPGLKERKEGTGSKETVIDDYEREDGSQYESG